MLDITPFADPSDCVHEARSCGGSGGDGPGPLNRDLFKAINAGLVFGAVSERLCYA
jgi:hypothetical protein